MSLRSFIARSHQSPGFLLLEVLLSITMISVGSSVIMRTYSNSIAAGVISQQYVVAANLLERQFWDILSLKEISSAVTEGVFDKPYDNYSFTVQIEEQMPELSAETDFAEIPATAPLTPGAVQTVQEEEPIYILYKIEVSVKWTYRKDEKQLTQRTAVIRKQPEDEKLDDFSTD